MMDFFGWNVGKLLEVNETTSLTLESRAFTVRFSIRDRSSLRQRMTFYLCSSHFEVEILNHVDLTPRFLDASTMTLMFFVLMVEILPFDQVSRKLSLNICLFAIQFGIQSDTEERCDYDFFHDGNHMNHKNDYLWQVEYIHIYIYIDINIYIYIYIFIERERSISVQKNGMKHSYLSPGFANLDLWNDFFPFFHPSNFGLFLGMTALSLHFSWWIPGLLFLKWIPQIFELFFLVNVNCIHKNTQKNTCPNHICNCSYMQPETSCRIFCGSLILRKQHGLILQNWGPSFAFGEVCGKTLLRIGIFWWTFRAAFLRTWIILLGRSPQVYTKLHKFLGSFAVKRHSPKDGHFGGDDFSSLFLDPH